MTDLAATPGQQAEAIDHGDLAEKMNAKYVKLYAPSKIKAARIPATTRTIPSPKCGT